MKHPETAKRIRQAMEECDISQRVLSLQAGVSEASISQYINGSHTPGNKTAQLLGNALNVSPLWLMGFNVPKSMSKFIEAQQPRPDVEYVIYTDTKILIEMYSKLSNESKKSIMDLAEFLTNKEAREASDNKG